MKVVICGAGQVGTTIAKHLATEGINVTVIDIDQRQVSRIDESYDVRGVAGHASHPDTLRKAGVKHADMLIAVTRSDEVNMVACQVAYSLFGVKRRIARIRHGGYLAKDTSGLFAAEHLPIDVIISPEMEIAERIARRLRTPGSFDAMPLAGGRMELLGIHVDAAHCPVAGERIADIAEVEQFQGMAIMAIMRKGRSFVPADSDRIEVGDDVYLVSKTERIKDVLVAFGHQERMGKRLIIVGAGNVGLHLAMEIQQVSPHVDIKIIEQSRTRAEQVANALGSAVVVLHGDALEQTILEEAQAGQAETTVAVTNDDETNIFVSVLAKQLGCKRAITLVNKRNYEVLMPRLGIDSVVSPSAVTISTVLRHVRRGAIAAVHTLREDFGEVVEAEITEESRLVHRPLDQLGLPAGMKVAAIVRDGQTVMARPEAQLRVGDRIVAVITYSDLRQAEALLGAARRPAA
ncbi:Trk system potassium transporter TrkA [Corticibacter populi]|uniref:Trk system potassium uptake protein TrkA n=1 Tax=Corticibacter populi TaxID=1550736 RepID=A0A3M6QYV8_9BURK|nr:Trk system potassium transporter TrkA [Corticibacter populi]RMX08205.1 Trk system potassium transporter TrkA [Corticibacter populi]RZS35471.1 trk system potassium uptake protein TrkA [Corticibacter populi]